MSRRELILKLIPLSLELASSVNDGELSCEGTLPLELPGIPEVTPEDAPREENEIVDVFTFGLAPVPERLTSEMEVSETATTAANDFSKD